MGGSIKLNADSVKAPTTFITALKLGTNMKMYAPARSANVIALRFVCSHGDGTSRHVISIASLAAARVMGKVSARSTVMPNFALSASGPLPRFRTMIEHVLTPK